jgi:hypothetical protein
LIEHKDRLPGLSYREASRILVKKGKTKWNFCNALFTSYRLTLTYKVDFQNARETFQISRAIVMLRSI